MFVCSLIVFFQYANFSTILQASHPALELAKPVLHYLCAVFEIFLLAFAVHVLLHRIPLMHRAVLWVFLGFNILVFYVDVFLLFGWNSVFNQGMAEIVLSIDPYVVKDFLLLYVASVNTLAVVVMATAFLFVITKALHVLFLRQSGKRYVVCMILFLVSAAGFGSIQGRRIFFHAPLAQMDVPALRAISSLRTGYQALGSYDTVRQKLRTLAEEETIIANGSDIPYVVFVLGESTDRNKMSLYGYSLKTSPFLEQRNTKGELAVFDDTIACANATTGAMQLIFSFKEKDGKGAWHEYPDMINVFKKAGYHTVWFSNQVKSGGAGNMDQILSNESNDSRFTFIGDGTESYPKDDRLLSLLDDTMKSVHDKNFYVLHLMGTHEPFYYKYPKEFNRFTPDDETDGKEKWKQIRAEYDNAVLYNDYVMDEIIKRFTDKDAVVIYISDHGEEVCDGQDFFGHSVESKGNRHMVEIPFVIWGSELFRQKRPALWAQIKLAEHRPFRTDNIIHLFLDMMRIQTKSYDARKSVINSEFVETERIYNKKPYQKQT